MLLGFKLFVDCLCGWGQSFVVLQFGTLWLIILVVAYGDFGYICGVGICATTGCVFDGLVLCFYGCFGGIVCPFCRDACFVCAFTWVCMLLAWFYVCE